MLDPTPYRDLAIAVVASAVEDLKRDHKPRDVAFFENPKLSELWIVGAGLDYDATISRLRAQGHLVAAPPKARKAVAHVPRPQRTAYQIEMERKVMRVLPTTPDTACSVRRIADYVGVYTAVVRTALAALKARGKADFKCVPLRGGTHAVWWKVTE